MNVLALPALGLANRAIQALPASFADLALRHPPTEIVRLDSTGHTAPGKGAARYVADDLCDSALLAAHPRFVFATANGRIFRLMPEAGSLEVEQGGAAGDGVTNDQPAIQAAIDYAEAIGASELRFESERYRIDCPARISPWLDTRAEDGHPIVIRHSLALRGCAATRSVFDFRALDGADPETNWQLVPTSSTNPALSVWRGGGIFLQGETSNPAPAGRRLACVRLDRLALLGNRARTGAYAFPADPLTGDGWDETDKALWAQDCYLGEIIVRDTDMIGWKGEIFYLAGATDSVERVELQRCRFAKSNGSAFNPGVDAEILAVDCSFGDCFQAQEDTGKNRAIYRNCTWHDCDHTGLGSGPCDDIRYNIAYPTRDNAAPPPLTLLENCEFRNIRSVLIASWVRGSIRTVDATVVLDGTATMALRDVSLKIDAQIDRMPTNHALCLYGIANLEEPVPGAPIGIFRQPPTNVHIELTHSRSQLARESGREWLGCTWNGYIDHSCSLNVAGEFQSGRVPNGGDNPISMPLVAFAGRASSAHWAHGWHLHPALSADSEIKPSAPLMAIHLQEGIIADVSLARLPAGGAQFGFGDGQIIRLAKEGATGTIRFAKGASSGFAVRETRVLSNPYDWIEFTYNREWQRWEESGFFSDA